MATQVQMRRGTSSENDEFTGAEGEITIDTTNDTIRVHDGVKKGGYSIPKGLPANNKPNPGTYTKVTVTGDGFVSSGESLASSDIPDLSNKYVSKNDNISEGTFAKITFDEKGLVKKGESLSADDIPALEKSKITGLQDSLDGMMSKIGVHEPTSKSGAITLLEGKLNKVAIDGTCNFILPAVVDASSIKQLLVQLYKPSASYSVNLGVSKYFGGTAPTISNVGYYNIYYEYDVNMKAWVAGAIFKGV